LAPKKRKIKEELREKRIPIRISEFELNTLKSKAKSYGTNTSMYLRNLGVNYPVKSIVNREDVLALIKTNGDLGKLGGLLKLWLSKNGNDKDSLSDQGGYGNIDVLIDEMEALLQVLHADTLRLTNKI
jgi:hypothetical protein